MQLDVIYYYHYMMIFLLSVLCVLASGQQKLFYLYKDGQ